MYDNKKSENYSQNHERNSKSAKNEKKTQKNEENKNRKNPHCMPVCTGL